MIIMTIKLPAWAPQFGLLVARVLDSRYPYGKYIKYRSYGENKLRWTLILQPSGVSVTVDAWTNNGWSEIEASDEIDLTMITGYGVTESVDNIVAGRAQVLEFLFGRNLAYAQ